MTNPTATDHTPSAALVITRAALLQHWQGHRALTRRVIETFPEEDFFRFSIGGMRPFSALAMEMISMTTAGIRGLATGEWTTVPDLIPHSKAPAAGTRREILRLWDEATENINVFWPQIPPHRFQEIDTAFGQYEGPVYALLLYWIDNEVHHRGQGYVYLRALGIEPPPFYDRS